MNELQKEEKSPLTIQAYVTDVKQFRKWLDETIGYETDTITETDVREYRQYLNLNKKLKVTSINRKLKSIVQFQKFLFKEDICKDEVVLRKVLLKNNIELDYEVTIVEKQDRYRLKRTIEAEGNKRDILIYFLLFATGVRCNELVSIEIDDIHLTERNGKNNYRSEERRVGKECR